MELQNYKKGNRYLIILGFHAMVIIFSLFGCGARKTEKTITESSEVKTTATVKVDSTKTQTSATENATTFESSETNETVIQPIDSTKEMVVNGKTYKNAVLRHRKANSTKSVDQSKKIEITQQKAVIETVKEQSEKNTTVEVKKTERKQSYLWLLWFLLLIPAYLIYRKYSRIV